MLFKRLSAALAAAAVAFTPAVRAQDVDHSDDNHLTFVSADGGISFGLSFPDNTDDQFYFALRAHRSHAWGAIGLGAENMPGALCLMVYDNHDQTNVTFSPRISYGHHEPEYYPDMEYELFEGTGIIDQHMLVRGRCTRNCLTWPSRGTDGGKIDVSSTREKGIYALGPLAGFASDDQEESLQFHVQYGSFFMNTSRAHGATDAPFLTRDSRNDGASLGQKVVQQADIRSTVHAVCMVLAFVLLMPLGAAALRLGPWVKWHAIVQTVSMVIVLAGLGLGVSTSFRYRRSWNFDSYHQIIGILVSIFVVGQFVLGLYNHILYIRTQQPSFRSKIHLWIGRIVLFLGIMNGFFGFTFALNRRYAIVLAALIIAMCFAIFLTIVGRRWLAKQQSRHNARLRSVDGSPYNRPPAYAPQGAQPVYWRGHPGQQFYAYPPAEPPPNYQPPQQNVGLGHAMAPLPGEPPRPTYQGGPQWGGPQAPRELI